MKITQEMYDEVYNMSLNEAYTELLRLDASILRHSYFYFAEKSPIIDDYDFDSLVARRQAIANAYGFSFHNRGDCL